MYHGNGNHMSPLACVPGFADRASSIKMFVEIMYHISFFIPICTHALVNAHVPRNVQLLKDIYLVSNVRHFGPLLVTLFEM